MRRVDHHRPGRGALVSQLPEDAVENTGVGPEPSSNDTLKPLLDAGLAETVSPDQEIGKGLRPIPLAGHSPGMFGLRIDRGGETCVLAADVAHHSIQLLEPQLGTIFDYDAVAGEKTRREFIKQYADTNAMIIPIQFSKPAVRLNSSSGGLALEYIGLAFIVLSAGDLPRQYPPQSIPGKDSQVIWANRRARQSVRCAMIQGKAAAVSHHRPSFRETRNSCAQICRILRLSENDLGILTLIVRAQLNCKTEKVD